MSSIYEYYNFGDDNYLAVYGVYWKAQTFTPQVNYTIKSVKLKLYKQGTPGALTVSIKETDVNGYPTGSDLCAASYDTSGVTTDSAGAWYEITFDGFNLIKNKKYAIVIRAISGSSGNRINWRVDATSPTYTGGNAESSSNRGTSWANETSDAMFETWGDPYVGPSDPPSNIKVYPIPNVGVEVKATFNRVNESTSATYARFQVATNSNFSNIVYDSGQVSITEIPNGTEGTMVFVFIPSSAGTYYYRLCFWDNSNYTRTGWTVWNGVTIGTTTQTKTLRPTGDNSVQIEKVYPSSPTTHYDKVDEETKDDDSTYLQTYNNAVNTEKIQTDLFNMEDFSDDNFTGKINSIIASLYYKMPTNDNDNTGFAGVGVKTHGTTYYDHTSAIASVYTKLEKAYSLNPYTSALWSLVEVNAVLGLVRHSISYPSDPITIRTTQYYITVNYDIYTFNFTPPGNNILEIGFPSISSVAIINNNDEYTFSVSISDTYSKPPIVSLSVDHDTYLMDYESRTGNYVYTYKKTLRLERGNHEYYIRIGNVWTTIISDTRFFYANYNLNLDPKIEVFIGNKKINSWNHLLTENILPDVPEVEFDTDEDIQSLDITVRFVKNDFREYKMDIQNSKKIKGGFHIRAVEKAKADLEQVRTSQLQAINSLYLLQTLLPDYSFEGDLEQIIYLQSFIDERITDIIKRLLIINYSFGYVRNKKIHLFSYDSQNVLFRIGKRDFADWDFDATTICNKLREYYLIKQYPVPENSFTLYDASNWTGTVSNQRQTTNGLIPESGSLYCLKGNGTINRTVNFLWSDFDQLNLFWCPDSATSLEIRLETDASNYRKYIRTFSGGKGAGFVLTASSPDSIVTKSITFPAPYTKYIATIQGTVTAVCSYKIILKLNGSTVYDTGWNTTTGLFRNAFNNIYCDTIEIKFTDLYPVGTAYGVNCSNLKIEEYRQIFQITSVEQYIHSREKYTGSAGLDWTQVGLDFTGYTQFIAGTAPIIENAEQSIEINVNKCAGYVWVMDPPPFPGRSFYLAGGLSVSIDSKNRLVVTIGASFSLDNPSQQYAIPSFMYDFDVLLMQTIMRGEWVWIFSDYAWQESYNLWDNVVVPFSQFTTVGSPTNQINTIRLIATGDNFYDTIYFTKSNPVPKYVEAENVESMKKGIRFQERKTDGWSSKESALAFATAFVNLFGNAAESYSRQMPIKTDINIGDMVQCDTQILPVYKISYDLSAGQMTIFVGRSVTDTLEWLKETSRRIDAVEKTIY